jgi:hypothetical protein
MHHHIDDKWNLHATTNKGWKKTPVVWVGAERAYQVKHDKEMRDSAGMLKLPMITIERTSVEKDPTRRGMAPANILPVNDIQGGSITIARRIKQDQTGKNANASSARKAGTLADANIGSGDLNSRALTRPGLHNMFDVGPGTKSDRTIYETISIPMPAYIVVGYKIQIHTEYQQQMNDLLTPFISKTGNARIFLIEQDGHRYEAFIENSYSLENNIATLEEEDRSFKSTIEIKVEGYLIGDGPNATRPKIIKRQSALLAIANERTIINNVEFPQRFVSTSAPSIIATIVQQVLGGGSGGGGGAADLTAVIKYTDYVTLEEPTGVMDDSNTTYTIAETPRADTITVIYNGVILKEGASYDFTISNKAITLNFAPTSGETLQVNYLKSS